MSTLPRIRHLPLVAFAIALAALLAACGGPEIPLNEPPVRSAVSASQDRVSAVSAGLSVATSSVPPVTLKPTPPGTPTKTSFFTLSVSSVSVARVRSASPSPERSTSTVYVSTANPTVPLTNPKTSIVTSPLRPKRSFV